MKCTADSWFIVQLAADHLRAYRLLNRVERGKEGLVIPTVILVERKFII